MTGNNATCGIAAQILTIISFTAFNLPLRAETPVDSSITSRMTAPAADTVINNRTAQPDSALPYSLPWNRPDSSTPHPPRLESDTAAVPATALPVRRYKKRPISQFAPRESLYIGISPEQDYYARRYVREIFAFSWGEAEKTAKKLLRVEHKDHLPPLSALLMVSARVFRMLHGEYESDQERRTLLREIDEISSKSIRQLATRTQPDSLAPLLLFIDGGIRGLCAALKIEANPVDAAIDGFTALNRLERLLELSPNISDARLGYGLFYCSLARAPAIVRAALNISGHPVTFDGGLDDLRRSAYHGRYTSELSKLYLIQFLSPYWGHLAGEKDRIFKSLQKRYPNNPYYVFLAVDEDICFHPERIDRAYIVNLEATAGLWKGGNYSLKRYHQLIRYQLRFIDTSAAAVPGTLLPDTTFDLREFIFYPQFLDALGERRRLFHQNGSEPPSKRDLLTKEESATMRSLGLSAMSGARKNLYEWHIRDALKLR